jgi:serine/threonine protein kinase
MNGNPCLKDFVTISVIGKGTYAKVLLVRHLKDSTLYALKVLKKKYILEKNQERHIMTEKQILSAIEHPFLVKLKMSFQDDKKLYFLLEYCPGGELFSLMAAKEKLTEDQYPSIYQGPSFMQRRSCWRWKSCTSIRSSTESKSK